MRLIFCFCLCSLLCACAPQPVRCDLHLRPINAPAADPESVRSAP